MKDKGGNIEQELPSPSFVLPRRSLANLDPVPTLLSRVRSELSADFGGRPLWVSRAPGRLDVMGGIADYTGSLVCEMPLDRAAAVAVTGRDDPVVQVFSFNLLDEHKPFTLRIPAAALATHSAEALRREFAEPGRRWAAYLVGCLFVLQEQGVLNFRKAAAGLSIAAYSTVPMGAGVSSSAAVEVAAMMAVVAYFGMSSISAHPPFGNDDPVRFAALCQQVENRIVGAPCGIMDQVTSCYGKPGELLRMVCQPHELQRSLAVPAGVRFLGINSNVKHSVAGGQYGLTRCAAFMAHRVILEEMRRMGEAAGRGLVADPMGGYLANLDPEDYKQFFRPRLPETIRGARFLDAYRGTIDTATTVQPDVDYHVQRAADHHVLEARRVRQFAEALEQANAAPPGTRDQGKWLDRAGHLMYASHLSYTNDAMLGAPECDLLVQLVREREKLGLYGAKITGGGSGGTVAVLADVGARADGALADVMAEYAKQTGLKPEAFTGTSPGAWHVGTQMVSAG